MPLNKKRSMCLYKCSTNLSGPYALYLLSLSSTSVLFVLESLKVSSRRANARLKSGRPPFVPYSRAEYPGTVVVTLGTVEVGTLVYSKAGAPLATVTSVTAALYSLRRVAGTVYSATTRVALVY